MAVIQTFGSGGAIGYFLTDSDSLTLVNAYFGTIDLKLCDLFDKVAKNRSGLY
jgi:hypothetical protein